MAKIYTHSRGTKVCKLWDHKAHLYVKVTGFPPCLTSIGSNLTKSELNYVARFFLAFIANHEQLSKSEIQDHIRTRNYADLFGSPWVFQKKGWN